MTRDELRRLIRGPFATVPTAMTDRYEIDPGAMAEATRWWVSNGLVKGRTVIKVAAAMRKGRTSPTMSGRGSSRPSCGPPTARPRSCAA